MREWLTVIIGLLILAVVLDGVRRMRQARRNNLRMSRRVSSSADVDLDSYSELPNGGARVVKTREPEVARRRHEEIRQSKETSPRIPQQVALNLDEHVPTLMEVEQQEAAASQKASEHKSSAAKEKPVRPARERVEPTFNVDELDEDHPDVVLGLVPARDNEYHSASFDDYVDENISEEIPEENAEHASGNSDDFREPEEVLVINVMAARGQRLPGDLLLDTVLEQGMRFGEMNIFHHHEKAKGAHLYSMANMVVPGTFDLESMREFSTPGVSLFLTLPSEADSSKAFETMLTTAQAIAANLGGELKDENRSVMTAQTIEHYRSRIREFERKQLSKAPL